jgi:hypothetical protein
MLSVTGRPELAEAETAYPGSPTRISEGGVESKTIVCRAGSRTGSAGGVGCAGAGGAGAAGADGVAAGSGVRAFGVAVAAGCSTSVDV